jgi:hypothetical protein
VVYVVAQMNVAGRRSGGLHIKPVSSQSTLASVETVTGKANAIRDMFKTGIPFASGAGQRSQFRDVRISALAGPALAPE